MSLRHLCGRLAAALALLVATSQAQALPAYARQTGNDCTACHIGAFGPQLTPYGTKFKIGGYTEGKRGIPLSVMAIAGFTNTAAAQPGGAAEHFGDNNNVALNEASVFLAGKLTDHIGSFSQVTYSGIDRRISWDNVDLRYTRSYDIYGKDTVFGLSLNNSPTTQDPWNTLPAWSFAYTGSELTPGALGDPLIAGGIGQQVLGLTAYTYINEWVYLEGGAYRGIPNDFQGHLGLAAEDRQQVRGPAPYWRVAVGHEFKRQYASFGLFGLNASIQPDRINPSDKFHDFGIDASYQYLGTRKNIFAVNARLIREQQTLYSTFAGGGSDSLQQSITSYAINGSYYFRNTYGLTVSAFGNSGSTDATLYPAEDIGGSRTGRPNTQGFTYQVDWTPSGKESSFIPPWINFRLGLQYTNYTKFNGSSSNYDGAGRKASDNNTLFLFLWTAF
jgi:hypothetical protein